MRPRIIYAVVAVLASSFALLAADVKIEGEPKVAGNKLVRLQVAAPAKSGVIWDVWPEGKADVEEIPGGKLIFTGPAGEYTVKARVITTADGGIQIDTGRVVVTIGTPPNPPPDDDDTTPTDPLLQPLQAAYLAEPLATRAADKAALSAVYYACAGAVKPASGTSTIKTAGELFTVIRGSTDARISDRLKSMRSLCGAELEKILPTDKTAALTDFRRQETYDALTRFAALLNEVK